MKRENDNSAAQTGEETASNCGDAKASASQAKDLLRDWRLWPTPGFPVPCQVYVSPTVRELVPPDVIDRAISDRVLINGHIWDQPLAYDGGEIEFLITYIHKDRVAFAGYWTEYAEVMMSASRQS